MTPQRWREIEDLYHAALDRAPGARAALLEAADPELRREVESLLAQESRGQPLNRPAWEGAASLLESTVAQITPGTQLGPYRIEATLGAGGMGEVFRATDTRLHRGVAIKISHEKFSARFEREAQAISALNHPNICTLYDVGTSSSGAGYLVMELVEGETLASRLKRGKLSFDDTLEYGQQIADALAAADAKGITHRDLKPGNIMVTEAGIKVLDFGLAKSEQDTNLTGSHMVLGTPAYMAPEQREGKDCDGRADIYAFGLVLYEMATGTRPEAVRRSAEVPQELERILFKCLEHDRELRYQHASEIRTDLQRLKRDTEESARAIPVSKPVKRWKVMVPAAAALAALLAGAVLAWRLGGPRRPVTSASEYIQLTNFTDSATAPALSPDGRMVTFFRGGGYFLGSGQIYVKLLPDGESKQLTFDSNVKYDPVFTPDGSRVAYTRLSFTDAPFWQTWTVPVLGGPATRLMANAAGLSWIGPDRVLFSEIMDGTVLHMGIVTAKESRAEQRAIYFPPHERAMAHYSWLSPDRDWVLIVEMNSAGEWQRCRVVPMDGNSAGVQVGPQGACTAAAWSPDGRWMYLNADVEGSTHLWRQRWGDRAPQGNPEQITFGPAEEEGLAVAPDGRSLIASVGVRLSSVWTHDAAGDHVVSLEGSARQPRLSQDGKRLYYLLRKSNSSDVSELWRRDLASGKSDPVLTGQRIADYDVSPDEARVAFTVLMGDESQIFLATADRSSPPRMVVRGGDMVSFGAGQLVFRQLGGKANYLARVQEDGSGLTRILDSRIVEISGVSPDGEWATVSDIGSVPGNFAVSMRDRAQRRICAAACVVQWSADGKYMYVALTSRFSAPTGKHTYIIRIPHGFRLLDLPASGIDRASEAELAGIQSIPQGDMSPGPDPQTYAFTNTTFQGNLFRIPLH
jgi:serine/threonine protein kinase/Tol biopolymer transport system component